MSGFRRLGCLTLALAALMIAGCSHKERRVANTVPPPVPGSLETGLASWYGHPYHGRRAANGEIYDMERLTAAHRTLPFETWVRVTNLNNGKSVDVRITDRGPFIDGRIIDLSHAAAKAIDMIGPGTAPVQVVIIRPGTEPSGTFAVQVGSFRVRENAERLREQMAARYGAAKTVLRQGSPDMWRVLVGAESSQQAAAALSRRIQEDFHEKNAGLIVRIDSE